MQSWELGASAGTELYLQERNGARGDLWGESRSSGDFPPAFILGEAKKNCDMENRDERGLMGREAPSSEEMVVWLDEMGLDSIRGISVPCRGEQSRQLRMEISYF